jgi:hypothetical protein
MGFYLSPGVYSKEKDISDIVSSVATTTGALVGYATKGSITERKLITNKQQFINEYDKPVPGQYFNYTALAFLENGNSLYCLRVVNGALYGGLKIAYTGGTNASFSVGLSTAAFQDNSGESNLFFVFGKDPGTWDNKIGIRIENLDATEYTFDIVVYYQDDDGDYQEMETWTVSRKTKLDGYGNQMYLETKINGFSDYILVYDNTDQADTVMPLAQATTLAVVGGTNGSAVTDSEIITGWEEFANPDDVDVRVLINGGYTSVNVQTEMLTIAEDRKDCIALFDIPYAELTSVSSMITWRNDTQNFNSSYGTLYTPWVKIYDQYSDKIVEIPPTGYVASQLAYNDYVAEPWYAAAGFNRGLLNVAGLTNVFTQGERDQLYVAGLNPIQVFRGEGIAIWGQKTLQSKASALDRINVRRLLIIIEKACSASLRSFLFELNSSLTRYRISAMLESYLDDLQNRGAFQTEQGAGYKVVCDTTNNTPSIIDRNELHVDIFVKPARVAEFIQLQCIITSSGASFNELISKGVLF